MPVLRAYGDRALLVESGPDRQDGVDVLALAARIRAAGLTGLVDVVPGAQSVLVVFDDTARQTVARTQLTAIAEHASDLAEEPGTEVVIDVVYDGADLDEVSALLQMEPAAVVEAHTATLWRVGFVGFAPGFAYLIDGDTRLNVPRRAEPRSRVPAGSVALAGGYSGVYPRQSPGGWQLIGRTAAELWDLGRPQPALLAPGMWVRFRAVDHL